MLLVKMYFSGEEFNVKVFERNQIVMFKRYKKKLKFNYFKFQKSLIKHNFFKGKRVYIFIKKILLSVKVKVS